METKHIMKIAGKREQGDFAKVVFGGAWGILTRSGKRKLCTKISIY